MSFPEKIQDEFTDLPIPSWKKTRLRRKRDGMCRECKTPHLPGKLFCEFHHNKYTEIGAKKVRDKITAGLCSYGACKNPLFNKSLCLAHAVRHREYSHEYAGCTYERPCATRDHEHLLK